MTGVQTCALPILEFLARYYDNSSGKYRDLRTEEDLAMMWGRHKNARTVVLSVHIVNKETGEEKVVNAVRKSSEQTTQLIITEPPSPSTTEPPSATEPEQLLREFVDSLASVQEDAEMEGAEDDFPADDDDEKAYPDVAADLDRKKGREFVVDPNFEPQYENDEDEEAEDEEMGCKYDDDDNDREVPEVKPVDWNNPTIAEGTVFENVEDCRRAVATYAIRERFEYIT